MKFQLLAVACICGAAAAFQAASPRPRLSPPAFPNRRLIEGHTEPPSRSLLSVRLSAARKKTSEMTDEEKAEEAARNQTLLALKGAGFVVAIAFCVLSNSQ